MFTILAFLALTQPDAAAQAASRSDAVPMVETAEKRKVTASLDLWGDATGESDFDDDNGTVQTSRVGADFEVGIPAGERSTVAISVGTAGLFYDFGGDEGFGASDPWDTVLEHTVGVGFAHRANEKWTFGARAFARSSGEQDADFGESLIFGGGGGFEYSFNENFSIGPGFVVISRLEDDVLVIPLVSFTWKISDKWSAGSRIGTGSGLGAGAGVKYQACETVAVFAGAGYQTHRFRLDDEDIAPNGVGESTGFPVTAGVTWQAHPQVALSLRGGVVFGREFTLDDEDGDEIEELDADAAPFLGATLRFTF